MTWEELATRPGAVTYHVFRGRFAGGDDVAWGTRDVALQDGRVEGRMAIPAELTEGLSDAHRAPPERASTTLVLQNADRALDRYMIGGPSPEEEYTEPSWLTLSGKLYVGCIVDGLHAEKAISPTLCVSERPSSKGATVTLPMATRDELHFGRSKLVVTVGMLKEAVAIGNGRLASNNNSRVLSAFEWSEIRNNLGTENEEAVIPWAYGISPIPMIRAGRDIRIRGTPESATRQFARDVHALYVCRSEPDPGTNLEAGYAFDGRYGTSIPGNGLLYWIRIEVEIEETPEHVWLVGFLTDSAFRDDIEDPHWIPSQHRRVGMPLGMEATPANILRRLICDHSELGELAVDHASFDRASESFDVAGAFGGVYRCDTPLHDLAPGLTAVGFSLWIDSEDKVQILSHGAWSQDEATLAKTGPLVHIRPSSIAGGQWEEVMPIGATDRGAVASRVTIDWSADQRAIFPAALLEERAPGKHRIELMQEIEVRIPGAWIYPFRAGDALSGTGSRRAFAARRFIATGIGPETRTIPLGALLRISHPLGSAPGGYEFRLGRLERRGVRPGEMGTTLQIEDLGPVEHIRPGKLDSILNWIAYDPSADGLALETDYWEDPEGIPRSIGFIHGGSSPPPGKFLFSESDVGRTIWGPPSTHPDCLGVTSYRIVSVDMGPVGVDQGCGVVLHPPMAESYGAIPASSPGTDPLDAAWLLMKTHMSEGPNFRPEYIRLAGPDGKLPGGDRPYALMD